jgi:hypothetical protein
VCHGPVPPFLRLVTVIRVPLYPHRYSLYFLLLAIGAGVATLVEIALPLYTSERQVRNLRREFLRALLRQEAGWHDTNRAGRHSAAEEEGTAGHGRGGRERPVACEPVTSTPPALQARWRHV